MSASMKDVADNLPDFLLPRMQTFGSRVAQIDSITGEQVTFCEILENVWRTSQWLKEYGLSSGRTVGICLGNCLDYAPLVLGVLQAGAVAALYPPSVTPRELGHLISISKPDAIVSPTLTTEQKEVVMKSPNIQLLSCKVADIERRIILNAKIGKCPANLDSPAFYLSSTGTTGMPKAVIIKHANSLWAVVSMSNMLMETGKPALGLMPFYHAYGLGLMLMALSEGTPYIVMHKFTLNTFNDALVRHKIHHLHIVPSLLIKLEADTVPREVLRSVRVLITSAGSVSPKFQKAVQGKLEKEAKIFHCYGLTESTHTVAFAEARADKPGSSGLILPFLKAKIIKFDGTEGCAGEQGELCLQGPTLSSGYYNHSTASKELHTVDGWLRTGDLAWIDSDGYLYIVDRIKDIIKFQGFTVSVTELELLIAEMEGVQDVAVISVLHEAYGEVPRAYVVKESVSNLTEEEIQQAVSRQLSYYKWLRGGVRFIDSMPKTQTMKNDRKALRGLQ